MKFRHYVIFAGLLLAGSSGSLLLVAREPELALIDLRDKEYDRALQRYERRIAAGDFSVSVVMPLCQLYLQFGKTGTAITVLERFVHDNPSNLDALRQLARYYQMSQRTREYVGALERLVTLEPAPPEATLRELSDIYNFTGDLPRQILTIQNLTRLYPSEPHDLIDLANLQAAHGQLAEAAATLEKFAAVQRDATPLDTVHFLVSVLLDSGQGERADRQARAWLVRHPDPDTAAGFASLMGSKGQAAKALALLEAYERSADTNQAVLTELTQLEVVNGKQDRALKRLDRLYAAKQFPDGALEQYLDLLLSSRQAATALDVTAHRDVTALPPWLLSNLADAAAAGGRRDVADHLAHSLGDAYLAGEPLLAARVAIARDDRQTAARLLATVALQPETLETTLVDLANLYLLTDGAAEGLKLFETIRDRRHSSVVDASWALIEAKAGSEERVIDWLKSVDDGALADDLAESLYFTAQDAGKKTLAVLTADRLYRHRRANADRLHLATALMAAGRPIDALPHLRALNSGTADIEPLYLEALTESVRQGAPQRDELRTFWARKLAAPKLSDARRQEIVYALLNLDAYEQALPALFDLAREHGDSWLFASAEAATKSGRTRELVEFLKAEVRRSDLTLKDRGIRLQLLREHGGAAAALPDLRQFAEAGSAEWAFAYEESLGTLGRKTDLVAFWKARAARADVSASDKRGIAFRSLEAGEKKLAEETFLALAREAPAESPDVAQLLFIWGPRPSASSLDWMESRAKAASGQQRTAWMQHLLNAGAARRAVAAGRGGEVTDVYLQALVAARDSAGLAAAIDKRLKTATTAADLRRLGQLVEWSQTTTVRAIFTKLVALAPLDADAHRRLGLLDYAESNVAAAKGHLEASLRVAPHDGEAQFVLAEILGNTGQPAEARQHYAVALGEIDRAASPSLQIKIVRALALQRLGRVDESIAAFESLLREQPENKPLRADYAAALLQSGRHDDGRRILALR